VPAEIVDLADVLLLGVHRSIVGVGDAPLSLTFVPEYRNQAGHKLPIARTLDSTSNLTTVYVENVANSDCDLLS
jgi:microcystin degradation protein MlrC